jgi:hypothetical protein
MREAKSKSGLQPSPSTEQYCRGLHPGLHPMKLISNLSQNISNSIFFRLLIHMVLLYFLAHDDSINPKMQQNNSHESWSLNAQFAA